MPSITTLTLPDWTVGQAYDQTIAESGGVAPVTFSVSAGGLPTGLSLDPSSGEITGTPTDSADSPYTFTITATDADSNAGSQAYTVAINPAPSITTLTLPSGTVGQAYSQTIGETGGTGAIAFSVSAGSLPVGLSLDPSTGAITGTPTDSADSPFSFTITATDAVGAPGSQAYSVTINSLSITTLTLPDWTVGVAYDQTIAESGGVAPVAFSVSAGSLPTGLSLDPNSGEITGTPTDSADSPYAFTITATDADGNAGSQAYTVAINPAPSITTLTLPSGTVGVAYSQTIGETGGTGAIAFSVSAGTLPTGLSLDPSTGAITGTPTDSADSPYAFTVTATDAVGAAGSQAYTVSINSLSITTLTLPDWTVGVAYDQTIAESGGVAPVAFSVSAGSLPTGLSLDPSSGAITGTPTDSADSPCTFTITATDADGNAGSQAYTVAINPAPSITTLTLPSGTVGQAYSQTIGETGGTGAIAFSVSAGTLPTGLSLDPSTGAITGTPTDSADSPFSFTVTATDSIGAAGSQAYSVTINSAQHHHVDVARLDGGGGV